MPDVHDKKTRSYNMSRIRSKDTKPEILVRKYLFSKGFRYRIHDSKLPGTPVLVFPMYKTALFIHGCFWHGHARCKYFVIPKTRTEWWLNKITKNKLRDKENYLRLKTLNWEVFTVFECELIDAEQISTLTNLLENLKKIPKTFNG